jgi:hypothetical protein
MKDKFMRVGNNGERFQVAQDVSAYKKYAQEQRQLNDATGGSRNYRSFAIIPDIVSIDIMNKYGLNIHDPEFMTNPADVNKFKQIIKTEYPELLTANQSRARQ